MFRSAYDFFKNQIFRQEISGTYRKRRASDTCSFLIAIGIASIIGGAISLATYLTTDTVTIPYDESSDKVVTFKEGTYYMYVELDGFYQNYATYSKSINYPQLKGKTENLNLKETYPFDEEDGKVYYPAGAVAATYFQDQISIEGIEIDNENITWDAEKDLIGFTEYNEDEILFPKNWTRETNQGSVPLNTEAGSGLPILNERFVNWIYLSMYPQVRKLWGKIVIPEGGDYALKIDSKDEFSQKAFSFSEKSWLGFKNYFLTASLFFLGSLSILCAIILGKLDTSTIIY